MQGHLHCKGSYLARWAILYCFFSFIHYDGSAQSISIRLKKVSLETAFREIEKRIPQRFVYTSEMMEESRAVSLDVKDVPLPGVLKLLFEGQGLDYSMDEHFIKVRFREVGAVVSRQRGIEGRVSDERGEALEGVTVRSGSGQMTATDDEGHFRLRQVEENEVLIFTSIGYAEKSVVVGEERFLDIHMSISVSELDKTVIIAYGITSQRLNTGNVVKVKGEDISRQPVGNVLGALEGRVPGMVVTQNSGVPGAGYNVQIRGRSSLDLNLSNNDPLIVIDGVPFAPGNSVVSVNTSAANNPRKQSEGGISPLNSINPEDIESVEVLKDADATAIYGSRGANGVILITTKKGAAGKTRFTMNLYTGAGSVTRSMDMLNTQQYVLMRREAFANDGVVPTASNARDILLWDTTRYTDLKTMLTGGMARTTDVQGSVSGGTNSIHFLAGAGYRKEGTVFPGEFANQIGTMHFAFTNRSANQKFSIALTGNYSYQVNELMRTDLTNYINLPPNVLLYDSLGRPNWSEKGGSYTSFFSTSPASELLKKYRFQSENFIQTLNVSYQVFKGLNVKCSFGYNSYKSDDVLTIPKAAIPTSSSVLASSNFGNAVIRSWISEPQLSYEFGIGKGRLNLLAGGTLQENVNKSLGITGTNYTNDLLLNSTAAAGALSSNTGYQQYRYSAVFARVHYNWQSRYLFNLTGRRDGSSRFGPDRQFANFGAVGTAWIFSNEGFFKKALGFISYGKLRGSYGITGNDQIGNYRYIDLWTNTVQGYQGQPGLMPTSLFNPDFEWEINQKKEGALDLGFLKDRMLVSVAAYENKSRNQLVSYVLPVQTGFSSVVRNLPALVRNSGVEMVLSVKAIRKERFQWESVFNISRNRNQLVSFPGLAGTSYASQYLEGESLNLIRKYRYLGVDPGTGIYQFEDVNKDGQLSSSYDYQVLGVTDARFYGGFQNNILYKGIGFEVFLDFRKQKGLNYLQFQTQAPGMAGVNQPLVVLERWQKPGDVARIQKFTQSFGAAAIAANNLASSDAIYSDASFIRFKTVSLSYQLPAEWLKKRGMQALRFHITAQNLFTVTGYEGADPETQNLYRLPPLRTMVAGIQISL
jgi:TonB-linked SusC/RagA family outer membrane protein